ncbi:hypothetical protein TNCV_927731 [Trichonephila clavipes]|nr:hypothetical protein TNCV_927731 [Trichonephila clavipes]
MLRIDEDKIFRLSVVLPVYRNVPLRGSKSFRWGRKAGNTYYDSVSVHIRRFKKYGKTYCPAPEGITLDPRCIEYIMRKKKVPESLEELPSGLFPPERHIQITSENFIDFTFKRVKYGPDKSPLLMKSPYPESSGLK